MSIKSNLKELTSIPGISSREDQVIRYMFEYFSKYNKQVTVDTLGNVICHFPSRNPGGRKLLIFGHMDEIGFVIRKIEPNGFLRVERVGGVHVNVLPGIRVDVHGDKGTIPGMIGVKSHHFMKPSEKGILPAIEDLYIDIGVRSATHANELGVNVGCFITYSSNFIELPDDLVSNKAMDNRVACAILLNLAEEIAKIKDSLVWDVYLVACVQEEFNIRGILPAVRRIRPDVSIGIDVTPACDTPDLINYSNVVLNGGPALTFLNFHGRGTLAGVLPDEKLLKHLMQTAEKHNIPYQREVAVGVITENAYIALEHHGVAVANVSIPTRYTHTPIETVSIRDLELTTKLLLQFVASLEEDSVFGKSFPAHSKLQGKEGED